MVSKSRLAGGFTVPAIGIAPSERCPRCGHDAWWRDHPVRKAQVGKPRPIWRCWNCEPPIGRLFDPKTMDLARSRS